MGRTRMDAETKERYIRWQGYRIQQFSSANNLFLAFAVAALGFWTQLLANSQFEIKEWNNVQLLWAFAGLSASATAGSVLVVIRLVDFRLTADIVKEGKRAKPYKRTLSSFLGKLSWGLLLTQIVTFGLGVERLTTSFLLVYGVRL